MIRILITNRKGGVGKTTTAINLGAAFSLKGKTVLFVDLDTQSHLQIGLGFKKVFKKGIHKALMDGDVEGIVHESPFDNLYLIAGDVNFDITLLANKKSSLREILSNFDNDFDICIIDTPPIGGKLLDDAFKSSDYALIPMQTEYLALVGASQFLKAFYNVITSNPDVGVKFLGVVPTLFNKSIKEHKIVIDKLKKIIGEKRVLPYIRKDFNLSKAFHEGKPIFYYKSNSRGATDYKRLADFIQKQIL